MLTRCSGVCIHHVLCETRHVLVWWLVQLLLDVALHLLDHVVRPVVRVRAVSPPTARLVIVKHLLNLDHHVLAVTQVREKLLNQRQLWHGNLEVKFLVVWAVILVVGKLGHVGTIMASFARLLTTFHVFLELESSRRRTLGRDIALRWLSGWVWIVRAWARFFSSLFLWHTATCVSGFFLCAHFWNFLKNFEFLSLQLIGHFL
jgi:hypothetical protein